MNIKKQTYIIVLMSFFSFFNCKNDEGRKLITVNELHELLQGKEVKVIDIRTPEEIGEGKIENALEADFYTDDFIAQVEALISKEETVYMYCRSGGRSAKAQKKLKALGYTNIYDVKGGIKAWKAASLPLK